MEDAGDQFEDDLLKAMQNSLEVNTVPLPAATQPNLAYRGMYNIKLFILRRLQNISVCLLFIHSHCKIWRNLPVDLTFANPPLKVS